MKKIILSIICLAVFGIQSFAQCSGQQTWNAGTSNFPSLGLSQTFGKDRISCDNSSKSGGVQFKAEFDIVNTSNSAELFSLSFNNNTVLRVKLVDNQVEITRRVQYKPCNNWDSSGCTSFGSTVTGNMTYRSWDDQLLESGQGWIDFTIADNGVKIKISESELGPFKTEFDYNGLHWSEIENFLSSAGSSNVTVVVPPYNSSNVELTNISIKVGQIDYITRVVIDDNSDSPETNYPNGGGSSEVAPISLVDFVETETENPIFKLYPNPAGDRVTLTLPEREGQAGIYFYRENGQVAGYYEVDDTSLKETTISTTHYSRGFYLVRVVADGKVYQKKLIMN